MIYKVYTDAATKLSEGYSSVAFLVLQGNNYIKTHNEVHDTNNIAVAESYALGLSLEFIVNELDIKEEDEVSVFCDSMYAIKFARRCLKKARTKEESHCIRPTDATHLMKIYDYIPKVKGKLSLYKIKAHPQDKNPHCYVDRLAKSGLVRD